MAKAVKKVKESEAEPVPKETPPDHLTMKLFAPGMSMLHRAGLGGLACTLKAMERLYENKLLRADKLPGPMDGDSYPWEITDDSVTLKFGASEKAGEYLKKLFAFAFQIRDGVIYLPGQYPDPPPSLAVRAEMQTSLSRTFLQGAKKNLGLEKAVPFTVDVDGCAGTMLEIEIQKCTWYLHQTAWSSLVDSQNQFLLEVPSTKQNNAVNYGSLYPGAIKRHDCLNESDCTDTIGGTLCALFFLVGCSTARLSGSGDGVLLIPDVGSLDDFVCDRPQMTPQTASELRVGGIADAAFQFEIRLRARSLAMGTSLPLFRSLRFSLRTWTKPQKSRVNSIELDLSDAQRVESDFINSTERKLKQFERALATLPRGVRLRQDETTYWMDSIIRPWIAENLAGSRSWYSGFHSLMNTKENRQRITYQRKELNEMIRDDQMWDDESERVVVRAVQTALGGLFSKIHDIYEHQPQLMYKKYEEERERWGRTFTSNMTSEQFRKSLCDMFRRGSRNGNSELKANWQIILPTIRKETWRKTRDLALIAVCSYQGQQKQKIESQTEPEFKSGE